jgi:hypothetical protein
VATNLAGAATSLSAILSFANTAPVLGALSHRSLVLGQTLSFTVSATDAEAPQQVLTFSLGHAPAGATLHPTNGQFRWTPATNQAPSTNTITVQVVDDGVPSLGATNSFVVWVGLPPQFAARRPELNGNQVILTFNTQPGKSYQVEYKNRLTDAAWTALAPAQAAPGATLTVTDTLIQQPQRYYRITVGD